MIINDSFSELIRSVISSVTKAISEDIPNYLMENDHETHNALGHMKSDCINTNLRKFLERTSVAIIPFKRFTWEGRILVDKGNHVTVTITTLSNLRTLFKKKGRKSPHFLQSILAVENSDCINPNEQMRLYPDERFDQETYAKDYGCIMGENADEYKTYTHYVIAYTALYNAITDIQLILLDANGEQIEHMSLTDYIVPDYSDFVSPVHAEKPKSDNKRTRVRNLVALKKGVRPQLASSDNAEDNQ